VKPVSTLGVRLLMGGVASFDRELVEGMKVSLARIKDAAEKA
jgi:hypothetical protein